MNRKTTYSLVAVLSLVTAAACGVSEAREASDPAIDTANSTTTEPASDARNARGTVTSITARGARSANSAATSMTAELAVAIDTLLPTLLLADGIATPMREATLSTKLMASITEVLVKEGDLVRAGQLLARVDARDLTAKSDQVAASVSAAQAQQAQAAAHVARMRALFADDAAPKAMLEAAETQLMQAESGLRAAKAAGAELQAIGSYAEIRAPFAGRITQRFVDPGAFAAPGAPIVTVQDASALRLTAHVTPESARSLRAGQMVDAMIEGQPAKARIEGVVPVMGSLYAVNAIVSNGGGEFLAGSAAVLQLPSALRRVVAVPARAIVREGDLTGVIVRTSDGDTRRWVRLGATSGTLIEVTSGLRAGEQVVVARGTDGSN